MTTNKFMKLITMAFGMAISACSFAATGADGDIFDIRPCDAEGNAVEAYASIDKPITVGGKPLYFKVSLETRDFSPDAKPWMLKHVGVSSELLDDALFPLQIGIFVSGALEYADLVDVKTVDQGTLRARTDFIFKYVSRTGDVALPIVLAAETTDGIKPATDDTSDSFSYVLNRTDKWAITTDEDTPKTPKLFFANDAQTAQIGVGGRVIDYTLAKCGFYIQTIGFDSNWEVPQGEEGAIWRSVHESSSITGGNTAPMLEALAAPDHAVTLYVWSTDDEAVSIKGGKSVEMVVGYENGNPITKSVKVGEITFGSGQMTADFQIEGAAGGEGKTCELVLSPWVGYNYNVSNVRLTDYVTVPVKCLEPLPPTVVVSIDRDKAYAKVGDGWKEYSAIVDVALTQPVATPIDVTVTPSIVGYDGAMAEYVRFSTSATSVKTIAALSETVSVTIPAGQLRASAKIYAFFLKADERTSGGATVDFTPSIPADQQGATGLTSADRFIASGCEVVAEAPRFDSPLDESEIGATAGVAQELEIELADTYAAQQIKNPEAGYKVEVKYSDSLGWKELTGFYYIGTGGLLRTADGKLPELIYPTSSASTSTGTFTTQIRVTDPINGTRVILKLIATVAAPKTVMVTTESDTFSEGETAKFKIQLNADNDTGEPLYAFLVAGPDETKVGHFSALGRKCVITPDMTAQDYLLTKGIVINPDNGGPGKEATASVKLLDGLSEEIGGSSYYFSVVLCTTPEYSTDSVVTGYNSNYATIQVFNVEPSITRIEMNKFEPVENGALLKFDGAYPIGQTQTFQAIVKDAGGFDLTDGFTTRWTITRVGGGISIPVAEIVGNPNEKEHAVTFQQAGTYKVKVQIKDKDMDDWSELFAEVYVDVVDQPQLVVADVQDLSEEPDSEMAKRRKVSVSLGGYYNAAEEMVVMITVIPPEGKNAGVFELDAAFESIPQGYADLAQAAIAADGTAACKHYFLKFRGTESQEISVTKMDGTMLTMSPGFSVKAQVLNTAVSSDPAKSWAQYYLPQTTRFYINNIAPVAVVTDQNNESNRWEVAGGAATQYPIRWTVRNDVDNDYTGLWSDGQTKGIKVSFAGCDNADDGLAYVTSRTSGTSGVFIPNFGSVQGDQTVTMTIEDKDGGYTTYTYLYKVTPSKFLTTISTGPSGGTTTSKLSQKYALLGSNIYGTLGQGHTFVGSGASFSSASNFRLRWNCSKKTAVEIYAYGYKVNNPVDNGQLDGGNDIAINKSGRAQAGVSINQNDYYRYTFADAAKDSDKKDSFFYCWIHHSVDENGGSTDSILGGTISPEVPGKVGTGRVNLPNEQTKDGNYLDTEVEAIFAREWRATDNLGDINADGIPDVFAMKTWGGGNLIKLVTGADEVIENDLVNLSSSNPDEDFLPAVYGGKGKSYAPIGVAFTTRMEIRGFGDGLNALDMTKSDADFNVINGNPNPPDETEAWQKFAEANGLNPETPNLELWSPEPSSDRYPRMDPTVEDTDGDGFPDGWEYYFWYQAHVNNLAQPGYFKAEKFNSANILVGTPIDDADIEARFNPCSPLEPDVLAKNPDFDGDGLSDLEELAIGTNPCHWDTDGDHMCDGWEVMMCLDPLNGSDKSSNPDGDFMAYFRLSRGWTLADANLDASKDEGGFKVYLNIPDNIVGVDVVDGEPNEDGEPTFVARRVLTEAVENARFVRVGVKYIGDGEDAEIVRYGLKGDPNPDNVPTAERIWGHAMVDIIEVGVEELAEGTPVTNISTADDRILIHDQVRQVFGFDPRTAWSSVNGYVANRWNPTINTALQPDDTTGAAINTRPYYTYDEYLVMKYRNDFDIQYYDNPEPDPWGVFRAMTTNPNVVNPKIEDEVEGEEKGEGEEGDEEEGEGEEKGKTEKSPVQQIAEKLQEAFKQAGSNRGPVTTHGADTDLDGVPDGWELYMGRNPSCAPHAPGFEDGEGQSGASDYDADGLSYALEYAGTDSCNAYAGCASIYKNHPGNTMGWFNKFFPTNPGINTVEPGQHMGEDVISGADTDRDGVADGEEGGNWGHDFYNGGNAYTGLSLGFIYGSPADDGSCCIRGAGMNPCTIDTDLDGIPDGWEMQHAGIPVDALTGTPVDPLNNGRVGSAQVDMATLVADGIFARLSSTNATDNASGDVNAAAGAANGETTEEAPAQVIYIAGGMDATFSGDVCTDSAGLSYDPLLGIVRDVDFDHDGLQNFQEYLIQSVRHFRYDDVSTPLMGRLISGDQGAFQQAFYGFAPFDTADVDVFQGNVLAAWGAVPQEVTDRADVYGLMKPWTAEGWRMLGYFAAPVQAWDRAITSVVLADPIYMWPVSVMTEEGEEPSMITSGSVAGYVTTDPRMADTDGDGMDDYYEMFHGLNPILGTNVDSPDASVWTGGKRGDIISAVNAERNGNSCLGTFNAYYNEWIFPDYASLAGRVNAEPPTVAGTPIAGSQAFDAVLYPWIMGTALADADGDGMRNDDERIVANAADPMPRHTDPTPLWFTERTTPASYVAQYYVTSQRLMAQPWMPSASSDFETAAMAGGMEFEYMFGFEEGEGYDTDGDFVFDGAEVVTGFTPATDPLKFEDPDRRQALYLDGVQSYALSREFQVRPIESSDLLKQFTVECWVRPEKTGAEQTIIERAIVYSGSRITGDAAAIRANFRIGLYSDGRVYGMFDNNDAMESGLNHPVSCQRVDGVNIPVGEWAHVALTFDGSTLTLYVNGDAVKAAATSLIPANGVAMLAQNPGAEGGIPTTGYSSLPASLIIGARPKKAADVVVNSADPEAALAPYWIVSDPVTGEDMHVETFANMREFFGGYIDEVRVWDGARTAAEIKADFRKRYTFEDALNNRSAVAYAWIDGATRNNNDSEEMLPAELLFHYNFMTLPGAVKAEDVLKTPAGFAAKVLDAAVGSYAANPEIDATGLYDAAALKGTADDLNVGWWNESLLKNMVYSDYHVVPWIQNTVGHLPLADGTVVDTSIYAKQFGAVYTPAAVHELAMFEFPNSAVPYSYTVYNFDRYMKVFAATRIAEQYGEAFTTYQRMAEFAMRSSFSATTDLIPLGNAYAKTCPKMWDRAVADAWDLTGSDDDADGLPDWWENLVSGGTDISWDTMIGENDVPAAYKELHKDMFPATAGELYKFDLINGMQPNGTIDEAYKATVDTDGDNIPDWWEKKYDIFASSDVDDDDGDGLSNWAEYLLSEVFEIKVDGKRVRFSPVDAKSVNGYDLDYFIKVGELYAGELFSDHDFIEDLLEDSWGASYASRYKWDVLADADEDGWSNFAEARYNNFTKSIVAPYASHVVGDSEIKDMPIPTLKLTLRYNGAQPLVGGSDDNGEEGTATLAPIVAKTFTREGATLADATFTIQPGAEQENYAYIGPWEEKVVSGTLTPGYVNAASFDLEYAEVDRNDSYTFFVGDLSTVDAEYAAKWPTGFYVGPYETYMELYSKFGPDMIVLQVSEFEWGNFSDASMITVTQNAAGDEGYICVQGVRAGEINIKSGDFSFDLSSLKWWGAQATNSNSTVSMRQMVLRLKYNSVVPGMQSNKLDLFLGEASQGYVKEGKNIIMAFYDLDGNGDYTPGEPYGTAVGVDVGWHQTKAEIELTDTTPIFPRIDLTTETTDRKVIYGEESSDFTIENGSGLANGRYERVRIVRAFVNGTGASSALQRVILDKWIELGQRKYLTEADILESGALDLDWDNLYTEVINGTYKGIDVTTVGYMIVFGTDIELRNAPYSSVGILRKFDSDKTRAVAQAVSPGTGDSVVYGTHPTFKWKMPSGNKTYTAFKVQILDGSKVVWDSGYRRAPAQDLDGVYTFEADAYIGDELENNKNYTWKVSMYNSKFKADAWSKENYVFRMNAPTVGAGYANIPVSVKYFGPANVANASQFVVEAFSTPDFTGIPAARAVVDNLESVMAAGVTHQTNAFLVGVPVGKYYLRAYADLKGISGTTMRVRDVSESWGYACKRGEKVADIYTPLGFTVTDVNGFAAPIDIYIEDVDTNGNCLPDAWELVKNGGKLDNGASNLDATIANAYAINKVLTANIQDKVVGSVETDAYNSYIMTAFASPAMTALALGYDPDSIAIRPDGSIAVESEVEEIEITGVGFDANGNVKITVEGKLNTAEGNMNGLGFIPLTGESEKTIECQVLYKKTLDQADWDEVSFPVQITVGSEPQTVTLKIAEDLKSSSSGFFKVKVTE